MADPGTVLEWACRQLRAGDDARSEACLGLVSTCLQVRSETVMVGCEGTVPPGFQNGWLGGLLINVFAPPPEIAQLLPLCYAATMSPATTEPPNLPPHTHPPQDLLQSQHHARLLAEALTHFISSATNVSPEEDVMRAPAALVGRAAGLLRAVAAAAPTALLSLDCLPQLQAAAAWGTPQAGAASGGCSSGHSGGSAGIVDAAVPLPPALEAVERLLSRSAALAASVGARVLSFSDAEALREIERAMTAGDVEAASQQLLKCTSGLGRGGGDGRAGA